MKLVKTVLKIDGMMCSMCEAHINDYIRKNFKIKKVSSSHKKGETVIESEENLNFDKIKEAVGVTGYKVLDIKSEVYEKHGLFSKKK